MIVKYIVDKELFKDEKKSVLKEQYLFYYIFQLWPRFIMQLINGLMHNWI